MTTVFGLKHPELEIAVLVADRQATEIDTQTGSPVGKVLMRKLWIGENGDYCFGLVGNRDGHTEEFIQKMVKGKIDVEKILKKGYFPELRNLNIKRMGRKFPDNQSLS